MRTRPMTLRGLLPAGDSIRLILDDGQYLNGFKVRSLVVWNPTWTNGGYAILSYSENAPANANAGDGNQIAWANFDASTTNLNDIQAIIDPDHVVQQDLYLHGVGADLSYLVVLDPITLSGPQGVLQLVKASRQDEP